MDVSSELIGKSFDFHSFSCYILFIVCFGLFTGEVHTLKHLLVESLPSVFASEEDFEQMRIIIHGIEVPLETPLQWLSEHFSHPDNFLHIVLVNEDSEK